MAVTVNRPKTIDGGRGPKPVGAEPMGLDAMRPASRFVWAVLVIAVLRGVGVAPDAVAHGAQASTAAEVLEARLRTAITNDSPDAVSRLLDEGALITPREGSDQSLLDHVVDADAADVLATMIARGDVGKADLRIGWMTVAIKAHSWRIASLLGELFEDDIAREDEFDCETMDPRVLTEPMVDRGGFIHPVGGPWRVGSKGCAIIEFTVTETGAVSNPIVLLAQPPYFKPDAERHAMRFRYTPKMVDGEPVGVTGIRARILMEVEEPEERAGNGEPDELLREGNDDGA